MRLAKTSALIVVGLLASTQAQATPFGPKSSREVMPAREVERPLDLPRGWTEFTLSHQVKLGTGKWSPDGEMVPFDSARWTYHTTTLEWRFGMSRRAEIGWDVPFHIANLTNDKLGTDTTAASIGDVRFRYRYRIYEEEAPMTALVAELEIKGPTGRETPSTYTGGPLQVSNFVFTSGQWDVYAGVAGRRQIGPLALTARLGYERRFSGLAQFVIETNDNQFVGRIKPGDRIHANIEAMIQLGPFAIAARPVFTHRQVTKLGVTAKNWLNPGADLSPVETSDGWALDLEGQLTFNATRGFDVHLTGALPLRGEDLMFFPIEDIHPTYGPTLGGAVEVRF